MPMFDLKDAAGVLLEVNDCRKTFPSHYVQVNAFDSTRGVETLRLSFIVNRPAREPGFGLEREEGRGPHASATRISRVRDRPARRRALLELSVPMNSRECRATPGRRRIDRGRRSPRVAASSEVLDELDRDLVGLAPVKTRIRDIAALLLVDRLRAELGLAAERAVAAHELHAAIPAPARRRSRCAWRRSFIGLGYVRKGHLVAVTRDDLVGQYIGHTAPKTREVLKRAMGGVLFIDEAYYLYRPENERDYGQEAIEILLQVMENQRDDLVVILAGYQDRMETFFQSQPGHVARASRITSTSPTTTPASCCASPSGCSSSLQYRFGDGAREAFARVHRAAHRAAALRQRALVRNALDRARLRQASRLFASRERELTREDLITILPPRHPGEPRVRRPRGRGPRRRLRRPRAAACAAGRVVTAIDARRVARASGGLRCAGHRSDGRRLRRTIAAAVAEGAVSASHRRRRHRATCTARRRRSSTSSPTLRIARALAEWRGRWRGMGERGARRPGPLGASTRGGEYLLAFDPLDGSSNIDGNVASAPSSRSCASRFAARRAGTAGFLQPGRRQVRARATRSTARRRCWC